MQAKDNDGLDQSGSGGVGEKRLDSDIFQRQNQEYFLTN